MRAWRRRSAPSAAHWRPRARPALRAGGLPRTPRPARAPTCARGLSTRSCGRRGGADVAAAQRTACAARARLQLDRRRRRRAAWRPARRAACRATTAGPSSAPAARPGTAPRRRRRLEGAAGSVSGNAARPAARRGAPSARSAATRRHSSVQSDAPCSSSFANAAASAPAVPPPPAPLLARSSRDAGSSRNGCAAARRQHVACSNAHARIVAPRAPPRLGRAAARGRAAVSCPATRRRRAPMTAAPTRWRHRRRRP